MAEGGERESGTRQVGVGQVEAAGVTPGDGQIFTVAGAEEAEVTQLPAAPFILMVLPASWISMFWCLPDLLAHIPPRKIAHADTYVCIREHMSGCRIWLEQLRVLKFLNLETAMTCEPWTKDAERLPD